MMKMIRFILLVVLSLFAVSHCFALNTARQYPELECVHGNMTYTIQTGDTLWGIAHHYGQTMEVIKAVTVNKIVKLRLIHAGQPMIIPCPTTSVATVAQKENAISSSRAHNIVSAVVTATSDPIVLDTPAETPDATIGEPKPVAEWETISQPSTDASATTAVLVADESTTTEPAPIPPPLRKIKRVKGYQLVYTAEEAKKNGLLLNQNLPTEVFLFNSEQDKQHWKEDGEIHNVRSRARMKGSSVVLSVSLNEIPSKPFSIIVVGLHKPIDGDYFAANCESLLGRFPGPRPFSHALFIGGKIIANGLLMTGETFNPILGLTVGIGSPIAYMLLQGHADHMEEAALLDYQRLNAQLDAEEFMILHPESQGDSQ